MLKSFLAKQMLQPHGLFGRFLLGPLWNRHNAVLNDCTLQSLHLESQDCVLDIGFGGGYLLGKMLDIVTRGQIAGLDNSEVLVDAAIKKFKDAILNGRMIITLGNVEKLPYDDGTFNKISSVNSIFYWSDLHQGLREVHRVLQKNGLYVLTFTVEKDLHKRGFSSYGIHSFSEAEITSALYAVGFYKIESCTEQDRHRAFLIISSKK